VDLLGLGKIEPKEYHNNTCKNADFRWRRAIAQRWYKLQLTDLQQDFIFSQLLWRPLRGPRRTPVRAQFVDAVQTAISTNFGRVATPGTAPRLMIAGAEPEWAKPTIISAFAGRWSRRCLDLAWMMIKPFCVLALCALLALTGCGGSAPPSVPAPTPAFAPARTLADLCASPRPGTDPYFFGVPYPDKQGTLADELAWVRSWINENYLWYQEVPYDLFDPATFKSAVDYFGVMKSIGLTASGKAKDQFHFAVPSAQWDAQVAQGIELGYGLEWSRGVANSLPRVWIIAQVEPNSNAAKAGLRRGDQLARVDEFDFAYGNDEATIAGLNAGVFPKTSGESHRLQLLRDGVQVNVALKSAPVAITPVQNVRTFDTPGGKVGYLTFSSHNVVSERQLVAAFTTLQAAQVSDLVLDMRYNGGGLLGIASELGTMIAGPQASGGKIFEQLRFNDKRPAASATRFPVNALGYSALSGVPLPYLGLKKVSVLTTAGTCSASEAVINALRGIDIDVTLIGGQTCGKPYGFYATPNCGTTYFAIEFQGVNDKGFGDYADGMAPTCTVDDDLNHELGDPAEALLATALSRRATGSCSAPPVAGKSASRQMRVVRPATSEIAIRDRPR
jgi:carboxyl-terminal processing protease